MASALDALIKALADVAADHDLWHRFTQPECRHIAATSKAAKRVSDEKADRIARAEQREGREHERETDPILRPDGQC